MPWAPKALVAPPRPRPRMSWAQLPSGRLPSGPAAAALVALVAAAMAAYCRAGRAKARTRRPQASVDADGRPDPVLPKRTPLSEEDERKLRVCERHIEVHKRRTLILLGDSMTELCWDDGWVAKLASALRRRVDVLNYACSGYNTRWALAALHKMAANDALPKPVDGAIVWYGGADSALPEGASGSLSIPVQQYREQLTRIVQFAQRHMGARHVLVVAPAPIDEVRMTDRKDAHTRVYATAAGEVAKDLGVPFVNMWRAMHDDATRNHGGRFGRYLSDGMHLNSNGNDLVFETMGNAIMKEWGWTFATLKPDLPNNGELAGIAF